MRAPSSPTARPMRSARTRTSPAFCSARRWRAEARKPVLLEVKDINTYRGPAHILRGVSISVDTDEVVALVGRNGAGRTTIIESVTGLLPVRSGQILFRDEEIPSLPPHRRARRGIGYAPEASGIFPELTVVENLMISRWLSAKTGRRGANGGDGDSEEGAFRVFPEVRPL